MILSNLLSGCKTNLNTLLLKIISLKIPYFSLSIYQIIKNKRFWPHNPLAFCQVWAVIYAPWLVSVVIIPCRLVQSLIKKKLLIKKIDETDKRVSLIDLTSQGKKLIPKINTANEKFNKIIEKKSIIQIKSMN